MAWVDKNVFFNGKDGQTMNSDARAMFYRQTRNFQQLGVKPKV